MYLLFLKVNVDSNKRTHAYPPLMIVKNRYNPFTKLFVEIRTVLVHVDDTGKYG